MTAIVTRVPAALVAIPDASVKNVRNAVNAMYADHARVTRVTIYPHVTEKYVTIAKSACYADHVCAVIRNRHARV